MILASCVVAACCACLMTRIHDARARCVPGSLADHELEDRVVWCVVACLAAVALSTSMSLAGLAGALP